MRASIEEVWAKVWQWIRTSPQIAALGEFLYNMGFWGEYFVLQVGRKIKKFILSLGSKIAKTAQKVGGYVGHGLHVCWSEITAPFRRFYNGIKNIIALMKEERKLEDGHSVKEGAAYFKRGVKLYYPLIKQSVAYVIPVLALGMFVYTVRTVMDYHYALAVEVNGEVVGYVENEQVFDDATAEIARRIKPINGEELDWKVEPSYTVAISDTTMEVNQMADSILRASSDEIIDATALYVNGQIVGITTDGQKLRDAIQAMKAPYEEPNNPELRVEFTKDVVAEDGIYSAKNLSNVEDIMAILQGEEQGELVYEVQKGDSASLIASNHGLSTQQLADMNPQQDIFKYLFVGDKLIIQQSMPYLEVRRILTRTEQEEIQFKKEEQKSDDLDFGKTKLVQKGEMGLDEVVREYVYYGNSTTPSEVKELSRSCVKEPVTEITQRGTKLANGDIGACGSGELLWPVPGHRYVSRWMSYYHTGADICAVPNTPILAADSGVVKVATYHSSYGNYVEIDHGNGTRTLYAHANRLAVSPGQSVQRGQVIAYVGSTGNSTGPHCHFEIKVGGVRVNPRNVFPSKR